MNSARHARPLWLDLAETLAVAAATTYLVLIVRYFLDSAPHPSDFRVFYQSFSAWRDGRDPYQAFDGPGIVANLNPPAFIVLLGPLAKLSLPYAGAVWCLINAGALLLSLVIAQKELALPYSKRLFLLGGAFAGTQAQLLLGQVAWLLMLPATLSWRAWRRGDGIAAGAWLGLLIGLKPLFLPLVGIALLRRQRRVLLAAAGAILGTFLIGGLGCGWSAYGSWLRAGATVEPFELYYNASLLGLVRRLGLGGWSGPIWLCVSAVAVVLTARRLRNSRSDCDRDVALGYLTSLLISPLGWVYYIPVAVGPLVAALRRVRWTWGSLIGVACLYVPIGLGWAPNPAQLQHTGWNATIGSLYAIGLLALWWTTLAEGRSPERT